MKIKLDPLPVPHVSPLSVAAQRGFKGHFWISVAKRNPLPGQSWNFMPSDPSFLPTLGMFWDVSRAERDMAIFWHSLRILSQEKDPQGDPSWHALKSVFGCFTVQ